MHEELELLLKRDHRSFLFAQRIVGFVIPLSELIDIHNIM